MQRPLSESTIIQDLANTVCQRIKAQTIRALQKMTDCRLSGDESCLKNVWEEICVQVQYEQSYAWDAYEDMAASVVSGHIEKLPRFELEAIWLQSCEGEKWDCDDAERRDPTPVAMADDRSIERLLIALVVLMSLAFLITAVITRPSWGPMYSGLFVPSLPDGSLTLVMGLIGTTIVPYNLFLHASSAREKWSPDVPAKDALRESRCDTLLAVAVGGLITGAIMTTAATAFFPSHTSQTAPITAAEMARQLEPMAGAAVATWLFSIGLLAAGLTSAITAPLAAAYAVAGVLNWPADLRSWRFRLIWMAVLATGTVLAGTLGKSPEQTILVAQVANGFLLPLIALFMLLAVNQARIMGPFTNGVVGNVLGGAIVLVVSGLAAYKLLNL